MESNANVPVPELSRDEKRKLKKHTHKCPSCDKMFKEKREMKQHHERTHLGSKHSCATCKKVFTSRSGLQKHQVKARSRPCDGKIFCKICWKSHKDTVQGHEKGVRHQRNAKKAQETAADSEKTRVNLMELQKNNVHMLTTLTGTALRVAMMEDIDSGSESEGERDWEAAWAADGEASD